MYIDGGSIGGGTNDGNGNYGAAVEFEFYQPKLPPIPDDACIIADYMLMADYIAQAAGLVENLPKGTRYQAASRDIYFGGSGTKGSDGGSGVVILRLKTAEYSSSVTGSPTITTDGDYTILKYTGSGTYVHS